MKPQFIVWSYLIYVIFWGGLTIGGAGYAVFVLGHSGWWMLAAAALSGLGFYPHRWYELLDGVNRHAARD